MAILTVYDIMGIQNFIFSSKELKDNIGASKIVKDTLDIYLIDVIKENTKKCELNWKGSSKFKMLEDSDIEAEILYIGGGNALVIYKDKDIESKITRKFSRVVFEKSYSLSVATAYIETNFESFKEDKEKLFKSLDENKNSFLKTMPLMGISITKQDLQTGLPISYIDKYNNLTRESFLKRENIKQKGKVDNEDCYINDREKYIFSNELDKLGKKTGESKIAVVHIDGNNMGNLIDELMQGINDYSEAVPKIRLISKEIDNCFRNAYKNTINFIENKIDLINKNNLIGLHHCDEKQILPIRSIILNGDDVTFVTNAKIALSVTEKFLKEINNFESQIFKNKLSACAGICIANSHFPFNKAYEISEECCGSAKSKAKYIAQKDNSDVKSCLDFHVIYSGVTSDLQSIRDNMYNVIDLGDPSDKKIKKYNLLQRPYFVVPQNKELHNIKDKDNFETFKKHHKDLKSDWPRTRLKKLREVFMKGRVETEVYLRECRVRGYVLPKISDYMDEEETGYYTDETSPYFDVIEMLDIYFDLGVE